VSEDKFTLGEISENTQINFQRGNKRQLMDMIVICAQLGLPLPAWASTAVMDAHNRYRTGKLKSWDDVFGKSFPGTRRKGALTRSRGLEVWIEVQRFKERKKRPIDGLLFEDVAKKLKREGRPLGASTIRNLYYKMERPLRSER
jgi:hypothetical protein